MTNVKGCGEQINRTEMFNVDWTIPKFVIPCITGAKVCVTFALCCLSAIVLAMAYFLLMYKRCSARSLNSRDSPACVIYCFLGNLSSTIGALFLEQLNVQVFMGVFMTALDIVNFTFIVLPVCLCRESNHARRTKMALRRRRRQNFLVVSIPMVLGASFFLCSGLSPDTVDRSRSNRRLLEIMPQDSGYILGYTLGLLSLVIGWTAKFPVLIEAHRGEIGSSLHISYGLLCAVAGLLYGSAVVMYDMHLEALVKAMPWLLTPIGCAVFDIVTPLKDTCAKKSPTNRTEVGDYIDVKTQPVKKVCLKEVQTCREGQAGNQPFNRVKVVRVDNPCSSDSSTESSSVSSDLEWDFEDANSQWKNVGNLLEESDAHPLQNWSAPSGYNSDHGCVNQGTKGTSQECDRDTAVQSGAP